MSNRFSQSVRLDRDRQTGQTINILSVIVYTCISLLHYHHNCTWEGMCVEGMYLLVPLLSPKVTIRLHGIESDCRQCNVPVGLLSPKVTIRLHGIERDCRQCNVPVGLLSPKVIIRLRGIERDRGQWTNEYLLLPSLSPIVTVRLQGTEWDCRQCRSTCCYHHCHQQSPSRYVRDLM